MRIGPSFRSRILAIVLVVAVLPLGVLGLWLTRATGRAGEALLRERLEQALGSASERIGSGWIRRRSELLDLAELEAVRAGLRSPGTGAAPREALEWLERHPRQVQRLGLRGVDGALRWSIEDPASRVEGSLELPGLPITLDIYDGAFGTRLGVLEALLPIASILGAAPTPVAGMVLGVSDPASGTSLLPLPFEPALLERDRFALGGDEWLAVRRVLAEPALQLVATAPLNPFTEPFERTARTGSLLLAGVAMLGLILAHLLTGRLTRSLERLAAAAEAVTQGNLERRIEPAGADEVGRVAAAFNTMTESLRRTLAELADRRALAAVGEFAASLAHEIRNPLTAIQVDLQMVEERLSPQELETRELQARALAELRRLDRTVAGVLQAARSGKVANATVDLLATLHAAARAAAPALEQAGARCELPPEDAARLEVKGDADALEQLFLNLLLNAAQAVATGGCVAVRVRSEDGFAQITIRDDGVGIPAADLERVFEPLYTTRAGGAGLGLAIARRLAEAHGGSIGLASTPEDGTSASVRIPLAEPAGGS
jgi:signal transduction histidine kinase